MNHIRQNRVLNNIISPYFSAMLKSMLILKPGKFVASK